MIHASAPNSEDVDRYSIAFNTFPSGDINLVVGMDYPWPELRLKDGRILDH